MSIRRNLFFGCIVFSFYSCLLAEELDSESLLHYAKNIYSQRGEDGIEEEIFKRLNISTGFFIEFGAADGLWYSNCAHLVEKGWSGIFIESDMKQSRLLKKRYSENPRVLCLNEFIVANKEDTRGKTISDIMNHYFPNGEVDFLSIDIDGADYLILEELELKPKLICVEGGFAWHPLFKERVSDRVALNGLQQPLQVFLDIGEKKGYKPICFTQNTFFIRNDLYDAFSRIPNDALSLWRSAWYHESKGFREWLVEFRKSPLIRETEPLEFKELSFE